jgi:hypothetical protein
MLTTGPARHRVTRRSMSGAWAARGRTISEGLSGPDWAFREIPPREEQRDGFAHFQTRRSGDK